MHDYHMHTNFSCDCEAAMADMCESAIAQGIPEIGFTEHYDLYPGEACCDWFKPEAWWAELERCRAMFVGRLTIRAGIELGEPHIFQTEVKTMWARLPFDYALGSLHWVGNESVFNPAYFENAPVEKTFGNFFIELEQMTRIGGFHILSHFDVPIRTAHKVYGGYDVYRFEDLIRPVLRNCIDHGIALDLNTAALRGRAKVLTPNLQILRWYVEMGGERVTLGADAHRPAHVGSHFAETLAIAREAGIRRLTYFEQGQATLKPLP